MTKEAKKLVEKIEAAAAKVSSFVAEYDLKMHYAGISLHSIGKLYYAARSQYRVEGITNGQRIITVSRNDVSQTYFVDQKLVSRSNTIEDQSPVDILHGLSDLRDTFSSTEKESLVFIGEASLDKRKVYHFSGHFRTVTIPGAAIVRMPIEVDLFIDQGNSLLLKRVWTQTGKDPLVSANYIIKDINVPLDEALFSIDVSSPEIRKVDSMDITKTLFFSDDGNQGASMN